MGRDYGHQRDYSEDIAADIDSEVRDLIEGAHDEAWEILVQYRDVLDAMVLELVEKETLAKDDLERILAPVRKRPPHNTFSGFGKRTPSDRPPIEIPPCAALNGRRQRLGQRRARPAAPQPQMPPQPDARSTCRSGRTPAGRPGLRADPDLRLAAVLRRAADRVPAARGRASTGGHTRPTAERRQQPGTGGSQGSA